MLIPGTQMHIVTFLFICIEVVIFFYLVIYKLARPDDKNTNPNIVLIFLLIMFNVLSGLLPDKNLPGSFFVQESIAYASGFITPTFFPYYVFKVFVLEKMKFHVNRGVFLFLIVPYIIFVTVLYLSGSLDTANYILVLPVLYAQWVIYSLNKAVRFKYKNSYSKKESKEEIAVMFLSITPWVLEPVIVFFNMGQVVEATMTNLGFLLLFSLHVKRHIIATRNERKRLIDSEQRLLNWNTNLQAEVEKRAEELNKISDQRANAFVNLAHEIKTPLTLMNNYFEEHVSKSDKSDELLIVQRSLHKLSKDVINLFDLERFNKGLDVYNHDLISNFSEMIKDSLLLFSQYAVKKKLVLKSDIEDNLLIKADPLAVHRIINNLLENAIKFSNDNGVIEVSLIALGNDVVFRVKDYGMGIPLALHKKVFEPYYQISNIKRNSQGMGLGLPIVKKVVENLNGSVVILSDPEKEMGTEFKIILTRFYGSEKEPMPKNGAILGLSNLAEKIVIKDSPFKADQPAIMLVEDNLDMLNYLITKLVEKGYNVITAVNGSDALSKLNNGAILPSLIICDVMMDIMDGYQFAEIVSKEILYSHIPIVFLTAKSEKSDKFIGLKAGAIDFIPKPFSINELLQKVESILSVAKNQKRLILNNAINIVISKPNANGELSIANSFEDNCEKYKLTTRESEIAKHIDKGYSHKEIAGILFISERTVGKHIQNIFEKLDVSNKIEMINKLKGGLQ
jgi:signal transduction histidine kinase/DNA-binding NarL/FixJ family response regulator